MKTSLLALVLLSSVAFSEEIQEVKVLDINEKLKNSGKLFAFFSVCCDDPIFL